MATKTSLHQAASTDSNCDHCSEWHSKAEGIGGKRRGSSSCCSSCTGGGAGGVGSAGGGAGGVGVSVVAVTVVAMTVAHGIGQEGKCEQHERHDSVHAQAGSSRADRVVSCRSCCCGIGASCAGTGGRCVAVVCNITMGVVGTIAMASGICHAEEGKGNNRQGALHGCKKDIEAPTNNREGKTRDKLSEERDRNPPSLRNKRQSKHRHVL